MSRLYDGRPVAETLDSDGKALPGCDPSSHDHDGKHTVMCIAGILGYFRDGEVWRRYPPQIGETPGDVIEHHGIITVRPCGRGITAERPDGTSWDLDALPAGRYEASVRLRRVSDEHGRQDG